LVLLKSRREFPKGDELDRSIDLVIIMADADHYAEMMGWMVAAPPPVVFPQTKREERFRYYGILGER